MTSAVSEPLRLAADFPAATEADWRKLVDGVLKGAPFDKLISKTSDGIAIQPLYPRAKDAPVIAGRDRGAPWQIVARVDNPDAKAANRELLHELENGATALALVISGARGARGFGLEPTEAAVQTALDGVHLDAGIGIELDLAPGSRDVVNHVTRLIAARGLDPAKVDLRAGLDPLGAGAATGRFGFTEPWESVRSHFGTAMRQLLDLGLKGPFAVADGRTVHDAGGTEAQELAFILAVAVAYLRAMEAGGLPLDQARRAIFVRTSADADQFLTLAKLRALRKLFARIDDACGLEPQPLFISAESAWRMLTQRDSDVNMLRATMATFSAALGGANAISVLPHTLALGLPDRFARRVARNTQLILLEESNLAKVTDPAAGAGGIEALTSQLCEAAWALFQEVEREGGIVPALQSGQLQQKIAQARAKRDADIGKRRNVITGASEFPLLTERAPAVLAPAPEAPARPDTDFPPLTPIRLAAPFEALRDRSDAILAKTGARPKVLLATLGTPADFTARATFAKSFFETGGIEAVEADAGETSKASDAQLVCLCSSDKLYATQAEPAIKALHAAGAKHIYLAGKPGDLEASLRAAGMTDFIAAGGDALTTLQDAYTKLVTP
jgi:methylmalonyl-CoA mutase